MMMKGVFFVEVLAIIEVIPVVLGYRCFIGNTSLLSTTGLDNSIHWTLTPYADKQWCSCKTLELLNGKQTGAQPTYSIAMLTKLKELSLCESKEPKPTSKETPTTKESTSLQIITTAAQMTTTPAEITTTSKEMTTTLTGTTPLPTVDAFTAPSGDCPTIQAHQSFESCRAAYEAGYTRTNGVFVLSLETGLYRAYCDMTDGGWMVIQKRMDGSQHFNLTFTEYGTGFGNLCGEFYWGNDNLISLMGGDKYNLRVSLVNFNGASLYEEYEQFRVHKAEAELDLGVAGTGTAGDGFQNLHSEKFCTHDADNDGDSQRHLGAEYQTGWWFRKESQTPLSNLNGVYYRPGEDRQPWHGIIWLHDQSLMKTEMKIRLPLV